MAAARSLVSRHGYEETTMQRIADACGLTPKTLYNQFGSRDRLLMDAVEELFREQLRRAEARAGHGGIERLIALRETILDEFESNPGYARQLLLAFHRTSHAARLGLEIGRLNLEHIARALEEMHALGEIEPWADTRAVQSALSAHHSGLVLTWAESSFPVRWLRAHSSVGQFMILRSVARGPALDIIDARLRAAIDAVRNLRTDSAAGTAK
jgi:AcrR family transcriptional regulator